jgi:hypothetical protein
MTMTRPNALASANTLRRAGLALAAGLLASACASNTGDQINDHWQMSSIYPRVVRAASGYDPSRTATYSEYRSNQWSDFGLTLQRHILAYNPTNPFQVQSVPEEEHEWSVPPNPYAPAALNELGYVE